MKSLVVYDTQYGNTQRFAETIGAAIGADAEVVRVTEADPKRLEGVGLLVVGSPTQGGRATKPVQEFLAGIPQSAVKGLKVASFDTRIPSRFARIFGYASDRVAENLKGRGASLTCPPEGFIVSGTKGPPKDGELERAAAWGKALVK